MAKISAKGCYEMGRWTNKHGVVYVYRSDGAVLQRTENKSFRIVFKSVPVETWLQMIGQTKREIAATKFRMRDVV